MREELCCTCWKICCRTCWSTSVSSHSVLLCWEGAVNDVPCGWCNGSPLGSLIWESLRSSKEPTCLRSHVFLIRVTRSRMDLATALESLSWKNPDFTWPSKNEKVQVFWKPCLLFLNCCLSVFWDAVMYLLLTLNQGPIALHCLYTTSILDWLFRALDRHTTREFLKFKCFCTFVVSYLVKANHTVWSILGSGHGHSNIRILTKIHK